MGMHSCPYVLLSTCPPHLCSFSATQTNPLLALRSVAMPSPCSTLADDFFLPLSHQMVHIGDMLRGDSFPSSSTAPPQPEHPFVPSHCNPEIHVITRPEPVWEKKCQIDGADHAVKQVTLIAVKSSSRHPPLRLSAGLAPRSSRDQIGRLSSFMYPPKAAPYRRDILKHRNIRNHQIAKQRSQSAQ